VFIRYSIFFIFSLQIHLFYRRGWRYNACMMSVKVREREGIVVVSFEARKLTDDEQILQISNELKEVLESTSSGTRLLLDFQDVDIVASMMLSDLVTLNKEASRNGVILQFCGVSSDVMRVIRTCKLDRLFNLLDDTSSAVT